MGGDGTEGRQLVWDLNQDGRIDRKERTITEGELFTATYRWRDYSARARRKDRRQYLATRDRVAAAVRAGEVPRVALEMVPRRGVEIKFDFIPRPAGDGSIYTVIRTRGDGTRGPKLAFDLDQDGVISAGEQEITEDDVFESIYYDGGVPPEESEPEAAGERGPA